MTQVDYIIVGSGFAGFFLAHQLQKYSKSFVIFSGPQSSGSHISAGVCNPVILKRFSTFWKSREQMEYLSTIFAEIQSYTGKNYIIKEPVVRVFHDDGEKQQWLKNSEKENLNPFLDRDFITLKSVENDHEAGVVRESCRIDVAAFFHDMTAHYKRNQRLITESFEHHYINTETRTYKNIKFGKIVFCEGIHTKSNPYFDKVPVKPNKGHCLQVKLSQKMDPFIIKKKHFLFSLSEDNFYYGGTYDRFCRTEAVDPESVEELEQGLRTLYKYEYNIIEVKTAFRATIDDRRPVLGSHATHDCLMIFNGMGARGVLNGTYFSKVMFDYIENAVPLDPEIDVKRFQ